MPQPELLLCESIATAEDKCFDSFWLDMIGDDPIPEEHKEFIKSFCQAAFKTGFRMGRGLNSLYQRRESGPVIEIARSL